MGGRDSRINKMLMPFDDLFNTNTDNLQELYEQRDHLQKLVDEGYANLDENDPYAIEALNFLIKCLGEVNDKIERLEREQRER